MSSAARDAAQSAANASRPVSIDVSRATLRLGTVSYLNARPLIAGLDREPDVALSADVPSRLLAGLQAERYDVALLPVIDYQRMDGLTVIPAGGIGCDGATLTVRLFSQTPIAQMTTLACDSDSHTSVALARIILAEQYGLRPRCIELPLARSTPGEARLLIGDKVVCEEPAGFEHQLDLGAAWKQLTGLPFVFAAWVARRGVALGDLADRLARAKQAGLAGVDEIIRRVAVPRGWPAGLALQYLTVYLKYDIGPRQLAAIERFFELAAAHELIDRPPKKLVLAGAE